MSPTLYQLMGRGLNSSRDAWAELKGSALPRRDLRASQGEDPLIFSQMEFELGLQRDSGAQTRLTGFKYSKKVRETQMDRLNSKEIEIRKRKSCGWKSDSGRPPNKCP